MQPSVVFGGSLRALVVSRQIGMGVARPRDIDIVVDCDDVARIKPLFSDMQVRTNRFGGLQVDGGGWQFDIWRLRDTWAFKEGVVASATFEMLPRTTFFNLEAIALDVWAPAKGSRRLYLGDGQFVAGVLGRTLELNVEENPFPALCLARSFVFANSTGFVIGPRLQVYLRKHRDAVSRRDFLDAQASHYGRIRVDFESFKTWVDRLAMHQQTRGPEAALHDRWDS